ncbi:MAG: hypothetical protein EOP04_30865, partial [Proteobacteria bacterium]
MGSWDELQKRLAEYGSELRERGAGFVISHQTQKLFVKASAVSAELSKAKLQKRFGPFEASKHQSLPGAQIYKPAPKHQIEQSKSLFDDYSKERLMTASRKEREIKEFSTRQSKEYQTIIKDYQKRKSDIKLDRLIHPARKPRIYEALRNSVDRELSDFAVKKRGDRKAIYEHNCQKRWPSWLQNKLVAQNESFEELAQKMQRVYGVNIYFT